MLPEVEDTHMGDQGVGGKLLGKTMKFVSSVLWASGVGSGEAMSGGGGGSVKGKEREGARQREGSADTRRGNDIGDGESLVERDRRERFREFGRELPKAWTLLEGGGGDTHFSASRSRSRVRVSSLSSSAAAAAKGKGSAQEEEADKAGLYDVLRGCQRVVVIGVHGWFPGAMIRSVLGEVNVVFLLSFPFFLSSFFFPISGGCTTDSDCIIPDSSPPERALNSPI